MYVVVQGCQWYICLPGVSPRSATSVCTGVDPALGCGFGSTWGEKQITDLFSKAPSSCCGAWQAVVRRMSYLPPSTGRGLHPFLEGSCCCLQWGHSSCVRPGWSSPPDRMEGPERGSPQPGGELGYRERARWTWLTCCCRWVFCRCRLNFSGV